MTKDPTKELDANLSSLYLKLQHRQLDATIANPPGSTKTNFFNKLPGMVKLAGITTSHKKLSGQLNLGEYEVERYLKTLRYLGLIGVIEVNDLVIEIYCLHWEADFITEYSPDYGKLLDGDIKQ